MSSAGVPLAMVSVAALAAASFFPRSGSRASAPNTGASKQALQQLRRALHAVGTASGNGSSGGGPSGSADRKSPKTRTPKTQAALSAAPRPATAAGLRAVADAFLKVDPREASDIDLVAVLLAGGTNNDPLRAAAELLNDLDGNLARVGRAEGFLDRSNLQPMARARMLASAELARRAARIGAVEGMGGVVRSAQDAEKLARTLAGGTTEKLIGIYFDRRLRLIGFRVLSVGSSGMTIVDPVEVFRPAIEMHASAIILAHNHPSGDGSASREDDEVTRRIAEGCATLGLSLLDHLVLGRFGNITSYARDRSRFLEASPRSNLFTTGQE